MIRRAALLGIVAALALGAPALSVAGSADPSTGTPVVAMAPADHLACVAPGDATGIDRMLASAGSPMAGQGRTIVSAATAVGLDPRAIVAIAAHETLLETYGPAAEIRNPFGLGPGWVFDDEQQAIRKAVEVLDRYYLAEGRDSAATIGPKWAPVGADNDPRGLNNHWVAGVSAYYAALGGDPALPMTLRAQDPAPVCDAPSAAQRPEGPAVVTLWRTDNAPRAGTRMSEGADPTTGAPATPRVFAFPLAPRAGEHVVYADSVSGPTTCEVHASRCTTTLIAPGGVAVVAAIDGRLALAGPDERAEGIGFWIEADDGDRFGYAPLTGYEAGIAAGSRVAHGERLGTAPGALRVAWERDGARVNPYALLRATRAPGL
jgi:hypothetical protein